MSQRNEHLLTVKSGFQKRNQVSQKRRKKKNRKNIKEETEQKIPNRKTGYAKKQEKDRADKQENEQKNFSALG